MTSLLLIGGGAGAFVYSQYFSPSALPGAAAIDQSAEKLLAPVISADELYEKMLRKDSFTLIDARSSESYAQEHVKGAINIPYKEIESSISRLLPFDRDIVTMCNGDSCELSTKTATKLLEAGFSNVKNYDGGLVGWKIKGYPVASGTNK